MKQVVLFISVFYLFFLFFFSVCILFEILRNYILISTVTFSVTVSICLASNLSFLRCYLFNNFIVYASEICIIAFLCEVAIPNPRHKTEWLYVRKGSINGVSFRSVFFFLFYFFTFFYEISDIFFVAYNFYQFLPPVYFLFQSSHYSGQSLFVLSSFVSFSLLCHLTSFSLTLSPFQELSLTLQFYLSSYFALLLYPTFHFTPLHSPFLDTPFIQCAIFSGPI